MSREQVRQDAPKVIVRVVVSRTVLEEREGPDGLDFYVIDGPRILSEHEWVEPRSKAIPA